MGLDNSNIYTVFQNVMILNILVKTLKRTIWDSIRCKVVAVKNTKIQYIQTPLKQNVRILNEHVFCPMQNRLNCTKAFIVTVSAVTVTSSSNRILEVTLITGTRNYQTTVDRWSQELLCGGNVERTDRQTQINCQSLQSSSVVKRFYQLQ